MDRKLFDEAHLIKNLPKCIIKEISSLEKDIPLSLFDKIFDSDDLKACVSSTTLPLVQEISKKSVLAMEARKKLENFSNKKRGRNIESKEAKEGRETNEIKETKRD